jgi:hypothetical protein
MPRVLCLQLRLPCQAGGSMSLKLQLLLWSLSSWVWLPFKPHKVRHHILGMLCSIHSICIPNILYGSHPAATLLSFPPERNKDQATPKPYTLRC